MEEKLISVITVVWNARDEIKATIESIIPLLNSSVELLVIDGGSTDGTVDLLDEYFLANKLRYISERDKGIYDAMNKGVSNAFGEWIIFINAGDRLLRLPKKFKRDVDMVCYSVETEEGTVVPSYNSIIQVYNTLPHQGIFYKKSSFRGFDDSLKIFADFDYNIKCFKRGVMVDINKTAISFHSLKGVSNSTVAREELKEVIKRNVSYIWRCASFLYFKYKGVLKRIQQLRW